MAKEKMEQSFSYALGKLHQALVFQVLEQTIVGKSVGSEEKFNDLFFKSTSHPELRLADGIIYLRGTNADADFRVDVTYFKSNKERDAAFDTVISAINAWGERHGIKIT